MALGNNDRAAHTLNMTHFTWVLVMLIDLNLEKMFAQSYIGLHNVNLVKIKPKDVCLCVF